MPVIALAAGSIVGGIISARASGKAAKTQAEAANNASALQAKAASEATAQQRESAANQLALQREQYAQQQKNLQPYQEQGTIALNTLGKGIQEGTLNPTWDQKFDPNSVQMDPAFERRLAAGNKAIMNQASARGDNLGSSTTQALSKFNQDYTSEEFGNAYGRAQQQYQQAYGIFNDNQARKINPLMSLAQFGQNAATGQNQASQQFTVGAGNTMQGSMSAVNDINRSAAAAQGEYATQAGNANASGYIGQANAFNNTLSGFYQLYNPKDKEAEA